MDSIAQVIHDCETCAAIKQAKRMKPLWYGGRWSKYKYGEAWQIDYITLPQTRQGKRHVLTMVEATTGWLETYPVSHATAHNTILGLEKQVLWRHGTPERIESDNGTHFKNNLIKTWAREHGIEWVYHIPYHAPAAGKVERIEIRTLPAVLGGQFGTDWFLQQSPFKRKEPEIHQTKTLANLDKNHFLANARKKFLRGNNANLINLLAISSVLRRNKQNEINIRLTHEIDIRKSFSRNETMRPDEIREGHRKEIRTIQPILDTWTA
ncbi:hypothetical protein HGM15179_009911 [Zosterops borbonicus]|uniref:Integrase catalytic domain-containing protein n=1 Tax=Zosterops borbonicus TaxID=364589 RepID=A0A8K1LKI3_9PASS|nr:hypothetical protein HGM15179_009911 [Zosterops borbonicus]